MILSLLSGTANGTARVLFPLYASALQADPTQVGLVGGMQSVGLLLLSLPIGSLLEWVDSRVLFSIGSIGTAITYALLLPGASSPWELIGCVTLVGLLNPFRMVTTQTELLHLLHTLGHHRTGWNRAAHTTGMFFAGPMLGAACLAALGFGGSFRASALPLLIAAILGNRTLSFRPAQPPPAVRAPLLSARLREILHEIASRADLRRSLSIEFAGQAAMTYFNVFVVLIGTHRFGLSTQAAAALISVQGFCYVGSLAMLGGILGPLRESTRYALSAAVLLVAEGALMAPAGAWMLVCGAAMFGIGLGIQQLTSLTRFAALTHELGRGRVGGMFTLSGPAGSLAGATCGGALAQHFGLLAGFRVLFLLYGIQLVRALFALHREVQARQAIQVEN